MSYKKLKIIYWILLVFILLSAFFLRTYNIENVPAGVYPDEAVNGMDALLANESGDYKLFYSDNNGREGLFINLIAFSFKISGVSILGLKYPSIIFGTLTVLGIFLLTKELFKGSWMAGLIASYMTAFSFWSINFSRIAFRAVMLPAILVFSFYFIFKGIRTKNYFYFLLSGLIFGLGAHTYIAFRIAPLILVFLFAALLMAKDHFIKNYWKQIIVFIVAVFITASPIILYFYNHPEYLESRSASISVFSPEINNGNLFPTLARTFTLSLIKYNFVGDFNWRHNYPPYPILNPIMGIPFLIGIIYVIVKFFRLAMLRFRRKIHDEKLYIYFFLLAWFFLMLAPEFLTNEGLPHALRSIGTLPVVYIFATIPVIWLIGEHKKYNKLLAVSLTVSILLFAGIFNTFKYHYYWANNPKQRESFEVNLMYVSRYLETLPDNTEKFILAENMQRVPIKLFNYNRPNMYFLFFNETESINPQNKNNFRIIFTERNEEAIEKLTKRFPKKHFQEIDDGFGNKFYVLK